tara:strand:+ start:472 stop:594 length:123 start_codon:yes stop_codon:yes gene_type:complete
MKTAKKNRLSANNSFESCGLFAQKNSFKEIIKTTKGDCYV